MELVETPQVVVEDVDCLKGQYLRHKREGTVWKVVDVGRQGVTVYQAEHYGGETGGPETAITWRCFAALYLIMVHAGEIDVQGEPN